MGQHVVDWWDGVTLWVAQLPFPLQFTVVMVVLLPACLAGAWLIDRVVDRLSALMTPVRDAEPPLGGRSPDRYADRVDRGHAS